MSGEPSTNAKLLVFLHVALKQRAFQSELQPALPGVNVTTVGRVADLERALKEGQDAVLTLPIVLAAQKLTPVLQGQWKGSKSEAYALVAADTPPDPAKVTTLGALDLLGREGMPAFVQSLVGGSHKIERVTKVEDLLPLLQLQRVDAILIAARLLDELKATSRMALATTLLASQVDLPAVARTGPAGDAVVAAVAKLSGNIARALGVDQWR